MNATKGMDYREAARANPGLLSTKDTDLKHILECAVVLSWQDLLQAGTPTSVHVEYHMGDEHALEYLKVWSSTTRGHWYLICEYWMDASPSHPAGLHFSNGYSSRRLGKFLNLAMRHQDTSCDPADAPGDGLVQIYPPTDEERIAGLSWISGILENPQRQSPRHMPTRSTSIRKQE
jgi:hypothetical protein